MHQTTGGLLNRTCHAPVELKASGLLRLPRVSVSLKLIKPVSTCRSAKSEHDLQKQFEVFAHVAIKRTKHAVADRGRSSATCCVSRGGVEGPGDVEAKDQYPCTPRRLCTSFFIFSERATILGTLSGLWEASKLELEYAQSPSRRQIAHCPNRWDSIIVGLTHRRPHISCPYSRSNLRSTSNPPALFHKTIISAVYSL
jgi:hypothetical protein